MNFRSNRFIRYLYWRFVLRHPKFKQWIVKTILPDKEVDVTLLGAKFTLNCQKEAGYYRALRDFTTPLATDELPVILNLALLLEAGDTFVDVGANIGIISGLLNRGKVAGQSIDFWAFEANPDTFQRLTKNVCKETKAVCAALSDRKTTLEFYSDIASGSFGAKAEHWSRANVNSIRLETARLDSFPIPGKSMVFKIDVEGHELPVLRGASLFFEQKRVKAVYVDGYEDRGVLDFLKGHGFQFFNGRTFKPADFDYSLLAIHDDILKKWNIL